MIFYTISNSEGRMTAVTQSSTKFSEEITRLRKARDLTKGQLASYAKCSPSTISMWESGKRKSPEPKLLERIAPYLGVSFDYLMVLAGHKKSNGTKKPPEYLVEVDSLEEKKLVEDYRSFVRKQALKREEPNKKAK